MLIERNIRKEGARSSEKRRVFEGWNNLSQFESDNIAQLKNEILKEHTRFNEDILPEDFSERDLLKFLQAYEYNHKKTLSALEAHFYWRIQNLPCKLTSNAIRLIVIFTYPIII